MKDYGLFYADLEKLISIDTTFSEPDGQYPFGKKTGSALQFFLERAREMGFETINYDNYAGEVCFGEGEEIGIIGHLDVVPAGEGWQTNPFELVEKDGFLFGRGVLDDKLPMLLVLYALNELKNSGEKINKRFRLFLGCNEETGWQDLDYLKSKTTMPEYGFSPDGNFPVCYAEKGIYIIKVQIPKLKNFSSLSGGTVINAVCAHATAVYNENSIDKTRLNELGLTIENGNVIHAHGVSAHGSRPELGKNALKPLFEYFLSQGENVKDILDCLFYDLGGIGNLASEQGPTTISPDLLSEDDNGVYISCDCRLPAPLTIDSVKEILDKFNLNYTVSEKHEPMLVDKNGWFVTALIDAYCTVTGDNAPPISMGGCSFARAFKYGCAFGPDFLDYDGCIHNANERIKITDIYRAYNVYLTALKNLLG